MPESIQINRRSLLRASAAFGGLAAASRLASAPHAMAAPSDGQWVSTTETAAWVDKSSSLRSTAADATSGAFDVYLMPDQTYQTIEGFGGCFNELGGEALNAVSNADRDIIFADLFAPDQGMNFKVCRLPIGANDFAKDWYSYNETQGDFDMKAFSIAHDQDIQIPYIKSALRYRRDLKLWASPWSPPSWMKKNKHYAMRANTPGWPQNGLKPGQEGREGEDAFILEDRYLAAYALYFRKFVEAYKAQGITISMVMPQNEFNSAAPYPSCCWTPAGLARFIPFLGKEMNAVGTDVFFGTLERPDPDLFNQVYRNPEAGRYIKGLGAQWAGRSAVPFIHYEHPQLPIYQSEAECGDAKNDWRYARHGWQLMKTFLTNGASVYDYWNIALPQEGLSRWGWAQNALITVNTKTGAYRYNHDYYVLKHLAHFVKPGAMRIATMGWTGYENMLAFKNPDGRLVLITQNDMAQPMPFHFLAYGKSIEAVLPADSFNTFVL